MALMSMVYFRLFRIAELMSGANTVLARDIHIGFNKRKFLFILRTSKTHWKNARPQTVKITSCKAIRKHEASAGHHHTDRIKSTNVTCPYQLLRNYLLIRGPYVSESEPFFILSDRSPVMPEHMRKCLHLVLKSAGFRDELYTVHSLRIGWALDLLKLGLSVETIKKIGHWKSNAVFKYLKCSS